MSIEDRRPVALTKSSKKLMMRYDGSSVTVALMSDLHGVAVAKVPTNATRTSNVPPASLQVVGPFP